MRIVLILLGMLIAMTFLSPAFLTARNLLNIVRQISVMGLIAIGVTMVIITGGIDLSSGSVLALAAVVATSLAQRLDWAEIKFPGLDVPVHRADPGGASRSAPSAASSTAR